MLKMLAAIALSLPLLLVLPFAQADVGLTWIPLGYQQISAPAAATPLTVPAGARMALITVSGQSVRWRDDGTAPTAAIGVLLPVTTSGLPFQYSGTLTAFQVIQTAASATVDVAYYR